ncbi:MAG: cation-translocating P-type ATPase [Phascolarctobacterium sp.]|nr:cation-translocating P-type ATPase [Phascolarctobacterium sp.]MBQ7759859.1 cation-translocating P-type ATPase [Acidaminococcaceae bacterium]
MDTIVIKIKGLRSAACVSSIEYKLQQLPHMEAVQVDFVSSEALLRSFEKINLQEVQAIIEANGFSMELPQKEGAPKRQKPAKNNSLLYSGMLFFILLAVEIVIYFYKYQLALGLVQAAAAVELVLVSGALLLAGKYLAFGLKQLASDVPHMDSLLAVSSLLAVGYSFYQGVGVFQGYASEYDMYCAAVAGAIFFTLYGKQNAAAAERAFSNLQAGGFKLPKAVLLLNDEEEVISGNHLLPGDTILVREGSVVPADGIVIDGQAELCEAEITGSTEVIAKEKGAEVFAETVVQSGWLKVKATATGKNVKAVQLWRLAKKFAAEPKSIQKLRRTDKLAAIFLPIVASISVVTALSWYFYTGEAGLGWKVLVSIMLGAYPCALGYAHSSSLLAVVQLAKSQGIVFKNPAVLEQLHKITLAVFSRREGSAANSMELVQLTALNLYVEQSLPEFLPDGRVRTVVDLQPKEKAELIRSLRWGGERTLVYGNRISDMPLLASGDVGVAVQNSATEQFAHIVLPQDEPKLILKSLELAGTLSKIYKRNSVLALCFNICCLPVAMGLWYALGGLLLEPLPLALVMLLSGTSVIFSSKAF